jgi:prefoldin subunit 1
MSIPNEALQKVIHIICFWDVKLIRVKVLQEIGQKKAFAEQQLSIVKQQKAVNSRENRMLQLTASEVESLPKQTKVYEGVGKMYVLLFNVSKSSFDDD